MKTIDSRRIAFSSFTKQAADGAATRAAAKFDLDPTDDLPYFFTLHAGCYRTLGVKKNDMMGGADYGEIGKHLGIKLSSPQSDWTSASYGDQMLGLYQYARSTRRDIYDVWRDHHFGIDWYELDQFVRTLQEYKKVHEKLDFTDLLELYLQNGVSIPVDVAFVDEYQDLSPLLASVAEKMFANAERIYYAGDDRQAVHVWAGAEPQYLIDFPGEIEVLSHSYRLPRKVFALADDVAGRIENKLDQEWTPAYKDGVIDRAMKPEHVDLSQGEWYLLARNSHHLKRWKDVCYQQGVPFETKQGRSVDPKHVDAIRAWEALRSGGSITGESAKILSSLIRLSVVPLEGLEYTAEDLGVDADKVWHEALTGISMADREYYRSLRRNGEKLGAEPRIFISTMHGVKGGERPNVALLTDMTKRTYDSYMKYGADAEHRVFYVGLTRASERVVVVEPQTKNYYRV
jgi:hypothetical protein